MTLARMSRKVWLSMKGGGEPGTKTGAGAGDAWKELAGDRKF